MEGSVLPLQGPKLLNFKLPVGLSIAKVGILKELLRNYWTCSLVEKQDCLLLEDGAFQTISVPAFSQIKTSKTYIKKGRFYLFQLD